MALRIFSLLRCFCIAFALAAGAHAQQEPDEEALWALLANGSHAALMRHAMAPGTGDPADFRFDDCSTQRNLSPRGREQAHAIGERFRENGIVGANVYSSQWCRCLETARLLDLGEVVPTPGLNSFFTRRERGPRQSDEVRSMLAEKAGGGVSVLVTHQVNITALTGVYPGSGEIVVVQPSGSDLRVVGRISPR
ncbi:Histidine phosphatase superfamily (branch 1) [Modicisalibacter ilicicola DSM 19980]|uniref:Histidine phosphatase superfamily (Branch 1) n=1 Tax=Modicisalibacter ilicicola DSM 19980 TaxID=1121942 RepID=A0A1M4YG13_9GAMM|nr:histidine phosphatase family protein [Halomonas ilicicola]SHF04715.1 Histidine phosphatase superfamily (branch 1) [Halomonas ilicicola DSM 19980]